MIEIAFSIAWGCAPREGRKDKQVHRQITGPTSLVKSERKCDSLTFGEVCVCSEHGAVMSLDGWKCDEIRWV